MLSECAIFSAMIKFIFNDGGRAAAGFRGKTDCGIRAMAVSCEISYQEARKRCKDASSMGKKGSKAVSRGMYKDDMTAALKTLGWSWRKAPKFVGRKARCSDMPAGRVIVRMSKHFAAVIDGVLHDTWDSSEKMAYGYWQKD